MHFSLPLHTDLLSWVFIYHYNHVLFVTTLGTRLQALLPSSAIFPGLYLEDPGARFRAALINEQLPGLIYDIQKLCLILHPSVVVRHRRSLTDPSGRIR